MFFGQQKPGKKICGHPILEVTHALAVQGGGYEDTTGRHQQDKFSRPTDSPTLSR